MFKSCHRHLEPVERLLRSQEGFDKLSLTPNIGLLATFEIYSLKQKEYETYQIRRT